MGKADKKIPPIYYTDEFIQALVYCRRNQISYIEQPKSRQEQSTFFIEKSYLDSKNQRQTLVYPNYVDIEYFKEYEAKEKVAELIINRYKFRNYARAKQTQKKR